MLFTEAESTLARAVGQLERRQPLPPGAPRGRARGPRRGLRPRRHALALPGRARAGAERRPDRGARDGPRRRGPRAPRRRRPGHAPRRSASTRTSSSTRSTSATKAPSSRGSAPGPRRRAACRSSSTSGGTSRTTSTSAGCASPLREQAAHVFAGFYQVRRAFHHIHANILGESGPARRLRAAVWQSIFTRDGRRYRRALYARMGDVATLVTGPSGTGKELVARAIGLAGYIPFDEKTQAFAEPAAGAFFPLNLAALSPTLIESELFGHRRGAFTGALEDRKGWFETCPPLGAVFLDEIGEVEPGDPGEAPPRAPDADLPAPRRHGGPRRSRGSSSPPRTAISARRSPPAASGRTSTTGSARTSSSRRPSPSGSGTRRASSGRSSARSPAASRATRRRTTSPRRPRPGSPQHLGPEYAWPGNVRELEQCVRNLVIRGTYEPQGPAATRRRRAEFLTAVEAGALSADALLRRYCTWVYARTGSYSETARRLGLDPRTVRDRVDPAWLASAPGRRCRIAPGRHPGRSGDRAGGPRRDAADPGRPVDPCRADPGRLGAIGRRVSGWARASGSMPSRGSAPRPGGLAACATGPPLTQLDPPVREARLAERRGRGGGLPGRPPRRRRLRRRASRPLRPGPVRRRRRMPSREAREAVWAAWQRFLDYLLALDTIGRAHQRFAELAPPEREQSFAIGHAAFVAQYRFALELLDRLDRNPDLQPLLNEPVPELGLPTGTLRPRAAPLPQRGSGHASSPPSGWWPRTSRPRRRPGWRPPSPRTGRPSGATAPGGARS